jgi:hypothetical protein
MKCPRTRKGMRLQALQQWVLSANPLLINEVHCAYCDLSLLPGNLLPDLLFRSRPAAAGLGNAIGTLINPDGKEAFSWKGQREYFSVPVPAGMDGKLWSFRANLDKRELALLTVPPYIVRSVRELLLPKEVVEADRSRAGE